MKPIADFKDIISRVLQGDTSVCVAVMDLG